MKIYIEIIIFLIWLFILIFFKLWFNFSRKRLIKQYNPEEDISRNINHIQNDKNSKGGVFDIGTATRTEQRIDTSSGNSLGPKQPERRELLPEASTCNEGKGMLNSGKNSTGPGKNSTNVRKRLFRRN